MIERRQPLEAQAYKAEARTSAITFGAIPERRKPASFSEVVDQRSDLTSAAVALSKLYQQIGVDPDSIETLYTQQTEGERNAPLTNNIVLFTIDTALVAEQVELGVEDGVKIAEKRRALGNLIHKDDIYTARRFK